MAGNRAQCEVLVIGAGFGGLYAVHRLRTAGFDVQAVEAAGGVGGTWYWNRYPGARCDVESLDYCYTFSTELDEEWDWSERFATQDEVRRYLEFVADRLDLGPAFTFDARIATLRFDERSRTWAAATADGREWEARFVVTAVGALSAPLSPRIPGLDTFEGRVLQTATWPKDVGPDDLAGLRVAVVGSGSSGVQVVPAIADRVAALHVFQRSPNFSVRVAHRGLDEEERAAARAGRDERRRARFTTRTGTALAGSGRSAIGLSDAEWADECERAWDAGYGYAFLSHFTDTGRDLTANARLADFVRGKIRTTVTDPETAERLVPTDHPIGAKRICLDDGYYECFNRDHVALVDLRTAGGLRATPRGLQTDDADYEVDVVVLATGFDAVTGALSRIDLRGPTGEALADRWRDGASSYLGVAVTGFPNLFTVTGPGSPSILVNVVAAIEQHVDWIVDHLEHLRRRGLSRSEATPQAQLWWDEQVAAATELTVHRFAASSWYLGTNVEGKPRRMLAYAGGLDRYRRLAADIARDDYRGFTTC
ncbi:NAD(P)/FAD-dependent oxidoreductase [Pseudonocardia xishanensis]|uniref:NAD(P)/FAD-dependent oxidoreductase n=1 Tax=Pseudonocardia xishanensis TaxID=630995 RepID=A0ABP8RRN9_9PSEU